MAQPSAHQPTDALRREQQAIQQVADRLRQQFPELTEAQIDAAVQGHYREFDSSRIRDFVPVLVERATRAELSATEQQRNSD